jgi:glycerophosphoryl diester phosphodiesterase
MLDALFARPPESGVRTWLTGARYAHRGLHGAGVPENSLAAFEAAIARGMGIECDVQLSSDRAAMVIHDHRLERTTTSTGAVRSRTGAALAAITLQNSDEKIPTLPAMLELVAARVPLLIEIKSQGRMRNPWLCRAVADALADYRGPAAIMSFDPRVVGWFASHAPAIPRGLVASEDSGRGGALGRTLSLWRARAQFLAYDVRNLPSAFAARQRRRGLPVLTWTVRSPALAKRAADHADAPIAEGAGVQ